jgi:hypothetical protein
MILKKIFLPSLNTLLIPRSLKPTWNNPTSPPKWPNKKFIFTEPSYLSIISNETVQNSKLKPKKLSFLCTLKET